jgi:two-component system chemotaxis response regulator CheY
MKIIIADDSATARMVIRRCLEIAGCWDADFLEAEHGAKALELAIQEKPDLLVTDLTMPEMDGTMLLEAIVSSEETAEIPVLVITSANNPAKESELRDRGAFAVLEKPVQPAALADLLAPILGNQSGGSSGW